MSTPPGQGKFTNLQATNLQVTDQASLNNVRVTGSFTSLVPVRAPSVITDAITSENALGLSLQEIVVIDKDPIPQVTINGDIIKDSNLLNFNSRFPTTAGITMNFSNGFITPEGITTRNRTSNVAFTDYVNVTIPVSNQVFILQNNHISVGNQFNIDISPKVDSLCVMVLELSAASDDSTAIIDVDIRAGNRSSLASSFGMLNDNSLSITMTNIDIIEMENPIRVSIRARNSPVVIDGAGSFLRAFIIY